MSLPSSSAALLPAPSGRSYSDFPGDTGSFLTIHDSGYTQYSPRLANAFRSTVPLNYTGGVSVKHDAYMRRVAPRNAPSGSEQRAKWAAEARDLEERRAIQQKKYEEQSERIEKALVASRAPDGGFVRPESEIISGKKSLGIGLYSSTQVKPYYMPDKFEVKRLEGGGSSMPAAPYSKPKQSGADEIRAAQAARDAQVAEYRVKQAARDAEAAAVAAEQRAARVRTEAARKGAVAARNTAIRAGQEVLKFKRYGYLG